ETITLDGRVVDEDILAVLLRDEAEAFGLVEPLHSTFRHDRCVPFFSYAHRPRGTHSGPHPGTIACDRDRVGSLRGRRGSRTASTVSGRRPGGSTALAGP